MSTLEKEPKRPRVDAKVVFIGLPDEIVFQILARLPVKDLLKFRCVCKDWKTLISTPAFIDAHLESSSMNISHDRFLLWFKYSKDLELLCDKKCTKWLEFPMNIRFRIVGSDNGVFCIFNWVHGMFLWNPFIRKFKKILNVPLNRNGFVATGFGFLPQRNDYVAVMIWSCEDPRMTEVEVYSHKFESWRRINAVPATSHVTKVERSACVNGVLFWLMKESSPYDMFVISFDLSSETFQKITLPVSGPDTSWQWDLPLHDPVGIRVLGKSIALFHRRQEKKQLLSWPGRWQKLPFCDLWFLDLERNIWNMYRRIILPPDESIAWPLGFASEDRLHIVLGDYRRKMWYPYADESELFNIEIKLIKFSDARYVDYVRESLVLLD